MGPDILGDIQKPRRNAWIEEGIASGRFGDNGAGLEAVAAGGLHSLFVDEKGIVRFLDFHILSYRLIRSLVVDMVLWAQ